MQCIAIFGGTFDPIHNGHIKTSIAIQTYFNFDSYIFLPCKSPMLKASAIASPQQRIEMIQRAITNHHHFKLDLREIYRDTPSYMVDTLTSFRAEYPDSSISLILGYDAFLSLPHWHQWNQIINLAHLLVINRNEFIQQPVLESIKNLLIKYQIKNKSILLNTQASGIFLFDAGNYKISSKSIREAIRKGADVKNRLPGSVYNYIKTQGLYL